TNLPPHIHPLSLHDALPISAGANGGGPVPRSPVTARSRGGRDAAARHRRSHDRSRSGSQRTGENRWLWRGGRQPGRERVVGRPKDRKSTRLNSSHVAISYAV